MPDESIQYELARAQTEARLAPMRRLRGRQLVLLGMVPVYFLLLGITMALRDSAVYDLLMPLTWVVFVLLFIQVVRFSFDYYHETIVQRETKKAMELERLRLLHALAYTDTAATVNEKSKRGVSLSDDGELIADVDEALDKPLRQNQSHR